MTPAAIAAAVELTAPAPRVDELRDRGAIGALAEAWDALRRRAAAAGRPAGPMLSARWFSVTAAALSSKERALRVLLVRQGDELVGALPLLAERRWICGVPARVLRSLSDDHSQRFDVLLAHPTAAQALLEHLADDDRWDLLELRDVPERERDLGASRALPSGAAWLVEAARARGFASARWASQASPYLSLPASGRALDAGLSTKFRANLRRRARRLVELHGPLRLERVRRRSGLARALDETFRLEAAGWKGAAGTAIDCDPALARRYRALARAAHADGRLALSFLRVGEVRVASHFALFEDGVYSLFKPGHLPALAAFGLGHLLVHAVAHALIAEGAHEIDLLGDALPWKRDWARRAREHSWRYLFRPTLRGRLIQHLKFAVGPTLRSLAALRP